MTISLLNYKRKNKTLWAINISHAHTVCLYKHLLNIKVVRAGSAPGLGKPSTFVLPVVCTNPACNSEIIRFLSLLNAHLLDFFLFVFLPIENLVYPFISLKDYTPREKGKWNGNVLWEDSMLELSEIFPLLSWNEAWGWGGQEREDENFIICLEGAEEKASCPSWSHGDQCVQLHSIYSLLESTPPPPPPDGNSVTQAQERISYS